MLGSVLAQAYRPRLSPYLSVLPAGARKSATVSIAQTQQIALQLGPAGHRLLIEASASFVDAMHLAALIAVLIAVAGAAAIATWMPGRRGAGQADAVPGEDYTHAGAGEAVGAAAAEG